MKQRAFTIRLAEYDRQEELSEQQKALVNKAKEAAHKAYARYSNYKVGAAALLENGEIITGNNQENAAYPSGLCAERVAIFYAGSQFPDIPVRGLAIAALQDGAFQEEPVAPCGGCRQVLFEKEVQGGKPMELILFGSRRIRVLKRAEDLLPIPFSLRKQ
jgi:cytidine deaminase